MTKSYKPGEKAPKSGTYNLVEKNGSKTGFAVKMKADDRFPPADKDGQAYVESN